MTVDGFAATRGDSGLARNRVAIVDAATAAFLANGYAGTTMEGIAKVAGVSKQTVYNHFPSKEDLFAAVVRHQCRNFLSPLGAMETTRRPMREVLHEIGAETIEALNTPHGIGLFRVLVAAAAQFPELGRTFFETVLSHANRTLAAYLEKKTAEGELAVEDAEIAAQHFFGLVSCHAEHIRLLDIREPLSPAALERRLALSVEAFLRAYAPRPR